MIVFRYQTLSFFGLCWQIRAEAQPGAGATFYFTVAAHGGNGM